MVGHCGGEGIWDAIDTVDGFILSNDKCNTHLDNRKYPSLIFISLIQLQPQHILLQAEVELGLIQA